MFFEDTRAALFTLLNQPVAVAAAILLAGMNAAIWLLVFQRVGFPTVLASLMIVPPFTFVLPLYFALSQWPSQRMRFARRIRTAQPIRPVRRVAPTRPVDRRAMDEFNLHRPMHLAADGLPRFRIALPPSGTATDFLMREAIRTPYSYP
jgi:hypothetical protein